MFRLYKSNINELDDNQFQCLHSEMNPEKQKRVERFIFANDKKRTIIGDALARSAISEYCGIEKKSVEIFVDDYGKPYAKGIDVNFSISHSNDMVICAVSKQNIGADIEKIHPVSVDLVRRVCKDDELYNIIDDKGNINLFNFFKLWTAKEAFFKMKGRGITSFKSVDFTEITNIYYVDVADGYVACIVMEDV